MGTLDRSILNALLFGLAPGMAGFSFASASGGLTDNTAHTIAAAVAGKRHNLRGLQFTNSATTGSEIVVLDDSTVIWRGYAPGNASGQDPVPQDILFNPPLKASINKDLKVQMVTTATATVVSAQGFTS
jgi:hypothetical protein